MWQNCPEDERACIRQNVCTSLRTDTIRSTPVACFSLHTSKRMHFIEEGQPDADQGQGTPLHTSKRMHFIEEPRTRSALSAPGLAYVKTYALH